MKPENPYSTALHWAKRGRRATLQSLDLSGTDLRGVDLRRADLTGTNLSHTQLPGAKLHQAILVRADLHGAILTDARPWRDRLPCGKLPCREADQRLPDWCQLVQ